MEWPQPTTALADIEQRIKDQRAYVATKLEYLQTEERELKRLELIRADLLAVLKPLP